MPSAVFDFRRCPSFFEQNFKVEDRLQPQHYVPFKLNSAQLDFVKLCATVQEQKQLTWIIAIKPRRVGLSRVVTGIGTMMAFAIAGMDGMVMAQLGSTLGKILESYNVMARGLPDQPDALFQVRLGQQPGAHLHHGGHKGEVSAHESAFSPASIESSLPSRSSA